MENPRSSILTLILNFRMGLLSGVCQRRYLSSTWAVKWNMSLRRLYIGHFLIAMSISVHVWDLMVSYIEKYFLGTVVNLLSRQKEELNVICRVNAQNVKLMTAK